jgi:hypothetical protein
MGKPIEQRRGQLLVPQYVDPLGERQVRRHEGRSPVVTFREQVE